jgi:hypothetical protein
MKMAFSRAADEFAQRGEMGKAVELSKKYFQSFPHFNFPYDYSVLPFIEVLIAGEEYEEAKKHMRILANESAQYMNFFLSIDENDLSSFERDVQVAQISISGVLRNSKKVKDDAFATEMEALVGEFNFNSIMD